MPRGGRRWRRRRGGTRGPAAGIAPALRSRPAGCLAAIAILKPDHVLDLGRRHLEELAVLDSTHAMAPPRLDPDAVSRLHAVDFGVPVGALKLEVHDPLG